MSFYIKNKTTHSRNILLSDNRNISIGATGSYNDTIQLADADIKDSVIVALSHAGILEIVSEENVAVKIQETAQEIEQNRRDKEQQLLAEMNAAKEDIVLERCEVCEKQYGIRESEKDGINICPQCRKAEELKREAEERDAKAQAELEKLAEATEASTAEKETTETVVEPTVEVAEETVAETAEVVEPIAEEAVAEEVAKEKPKKKKATTKKETK